MRALASWLRATSNTVYRPRRRPRIPSSTIHLSNNPAPQGAPPGPPHQPPRREGRFYTSGLVTLSNPFAQIFATIFAPRKNQLPGPNISENEPAPTRLPSSAGQLYMESIRTDFKTEAPGSPSLLLDPRNTQMLHPGTLPLTAASRSDTGRYGGVSSLFKPRSFWDHGPAAR